MWHWGRRIFGGLVGCILSNVPLKNGDVILAGASCAWRAGNF
jgi:hypothetical protein